MIRHVALFRWRKNAAPEARDALAAGLAALPREIESISAYRFGADLRLVDGNWDFAVVADFADRDGYLAYRDHPAHRRVIDELLSPILAERASLQYEIGG